ncbi:MAG TPA: DUF2905 domain-containing protein [Hyphomicrobium sp.]
MASFLITVGIIALTLGLITYVVDSRTPGGEAHSRPLTLLPGDIKYESPNGSFRFYFPITTSIVLSLVLTLVLSLIS